MRYYAAVDKVAVAVMEGAAEGARVRRFTDGSLPGLDLTALCRVARGKVQPLLDAWPPRREYKRLVRVHAAELTAELETEIAAADAGA